MASDLFSALKIRGLTLKNRVVLSPMLTYAAERGFVSRWHSMHLGKFAAGGVGLVFMESTKIDPRGCSTAHDAGLWKDEFIEPLRELTTFVNGLGAAIGIQLSHSGRKARNSLPWEGRAPLNRRMTVEDGIEWTLAAPSAIAHSPKHPVPSEMSISEIADSVEAWGQAARRADLAGFDVVEFHAAHGYLIHQFLSPHANQRQDRYGGSLKNRMRYAVEVAESVRRYWPDEKPLFARISATDDFGWTLDDSIALSRCLQASGVDVIDCSSGGMGEGAVVGAKENGYGYQVPFARAVRETSDIKTMAVGLVVHPTQAQAIIDSGSADLVALGRELLHNPNWTIDAAQKLGMSPSSPGIPPAYGYWLDKRARAENGVLPSTWGADALPSES